MAIVRIPKKSRAVAMTELPTTLGSAKLPILLPKATHSINQPAVAAVAITAIVLSPGRPARTTFKTPVKAAAIDAPSDHTNNPLMNGVQRIVPTVWPQLERISNTPNTRSANFIAGPPRSQIRQTCRVSLAIHQVHRSSPGLYLPLAHMPRDFGVRTPRESCAHPRK